jgi:hypothetical protein
MATEQRRAAVMSGMLGPLFRCVIRRGMEPKVEDAAHGGANWTAESVRAEAMGDYFATNARFLCGEDQLNRSSGKYICRRGRVCIEDLLAHF